MQMNQTLFQEVHLCGRVCRFSGGDGREQAGMCMCLGMLLSLSNRLCTVAGWQHKDR